MCMSAMGVMWRSEENFWQLVHSGIGEGKREICFYLCASVYVCMSICHMCGYQGRPEEGIGSLEMEL